MSNFEAWNAMSEAEQVSMIRQKIYGAAKVDHVRVTDPWEYIGGAWERIAKNVRQDDEPLDVIVYNAARACIVQEKRADTKHSVACVREIESEKGETASFVEVLIASGRDNTERQAIIRADMARFMETCDKTNLEILERRAEGYTCKEIAAMIGLCNATIYYRLAKMREELIGGLA